MNTNTLTRNTATASFHVTCFFFFSLWKFWTLQLKVHFNFDWGNRNLWHHQGVPPYSGDMTTERVKHEAWCTGVLLCWLKFPWNFPGKSQISLFPGINKEFILLYSELLFRTCVSSRQNPFSKLLETISLLSSTRVNTKHRELWQCE